MMRDVNDNEQISYLYSLMGIVNLSVVEPERTYDIGAQYQIDVCPEVHQAYLVDSSLTGVLRVRILGWIWFLLNTSSHGRLSNESPVVVLNHSL